MERRKRGERGYRSLIAWQKSMDFAVRVLDLCDVIPIRTGAGVVSQLRRSVVSIPSNIAEGKAIGGLSYPRHLRIAHGSEAELQTQIELARRLKFLGDAEANALLSQASEVGRMLVGLQRSLPKN